MPNHQGLPVLNIKQLNFCDEAIGKVDLLGIREPGDEDDDDGMV